MRLTAGKVLLDQSMLASESGSPHRSRVTPYLGVVDLSPARVGPVIATQGVRSANCLVDCRRNGGSECPCNWHDFEVIPVMAFLRGRFSRQSSRPARCSSFPISRIS